jgi:CRP-like cAMP-binding protein
MSAPPDTGNRLLGRLSAHRRAQLRRHLTTVPLARGEVLFEPEQELADVYFPDAGVLSLLVVTESGAVAEAATIGAEGAVGLVGALGSRTAYCQCLVQVEGSASRIPARRLAELMDRFADLRGVLYCYADALFCQVLQSVACNALHTVEARLSRWLLTMQDRAGGAPELPLTQAFLAEMLGVQRTTVTAAAGALERAGLIRSGRGRVRILNRAGLKRASCDCYRLVRRRYEELLPPSRGR